MAALTKSKTREHKRTDATSMLMKGSTLIYKGALVANGVDGYAVNATDTAGLRVAGIAQDDVDNSAGADGEKSIIVDYPVFHEWSFSASGADESWQNQKVYVVDNDTVALSGTVNSIVAGTCTLVESATSVRVRFEI